MLVLFSAHKPKIEMGNRKLSKFPRVADLAVGRAARNKRLGAFPNVKKTGSIPKQPRSNQSNSNSTRTLQNRKIRQLPATLVNSCIAWLT